VTDWIEGEGYEVLDETEKMGRLYKQESCRDEIYLVNESRLWKFNEKI